MISCGHDPTRPSAHRAIDLRVAPPLGEAASPPEDPRFSIRSGVFHARQTHCLVALHVHHLDMEENAIGDLSSHRPQGGSREPASRAAAVRSRAAGCRPTHHGAGPAAGSADPRAPHRPPASARASPRRRCRLRRRPFRAASGLNMGTLGLLSRAPSAGHCVTYRRPLIGLISRHVVVSFWPLYGFHMARKDGWSRCGLNVTSKRPFCGR